MVYILHILLLLPLLLIITTINAVCWQSSAWRMIWGRWKWEEYPARTSTSNVSWANNIHVTRALFHSKFRFISFHQLIHCSHPHISSPLCDRWECVRLTVDGDSNVARQIIFNRCCCAAEPRLGRGGCSTHACVVTVQVSTRGWSLGALWSSSPTTSTWTIETCTHTVCTRASWMEWTAAAWGVVWVGLVLIGCKQRAAAELVCAQRAC